MDTEISIQKPKQVLLSSLQSFFDVLQGHPLFGFIVDKLNHADGLLLSHAKQSIRKRHIRCRHTKEIGPLCTKKMKTKISGSDRMAMLASSVF